MITPRKDFQENKTLSKPWQDFVDGPMFRAAALAALAEYQLRLSAAPDMGTAAAYQFRMEGAKGFLSTLTGLMTPDQPMPKSPVGNLKHTA